MMNNRFYKIGLCLILGLILLAPAACQKNDDDDDSGAEGDDDDFVPTSIVFTPETSQGTGEIRLELKSADPQLSAFVLNVIGDGISQAYGVAGRLEFDTEIAGLQAVEPGEGLAANEATIKALGAGNEEGAVFGFSRSADYTHSVDLAAAKPIGTLTFTVAGPGETKLAFMESRCTVLNHDLDSVEVERWLGGTLTVE